MSRYVVDVGLLFMASHEENNEGGGMWLIDNEQDALLRLEGSIKPDNSIRRWKNHYNKKHLL